MHHKLPRFWGILAGLVLVLAGCASSQTASTSLPATPTATSVPTAISTPASSPTGSTNVSNTNSDLIRIVLVPGKSQASYHVREQLVNVALPNDAVGTTQQITGTIAIKSDGTIDSSISKFTVEVGTLQTDRSQRDNYVRRNILQTDQYPEAVFVPTQTSGLPGSLPQSGDVAFKLIGNLTLRDVTKQVTWDVTGKVQGNEFTGQATTSFTFEDFNLTQPRVPIVLSVQDNIKLEVNIDLVRANN
jgi:polyisoprenoid-binding protein YceI